MSYALGNVLILVFGFVAFVAGAVAAGAWLAIVFIAFRALTGWPA